MIPSTTLQLCLLVAIYIHASAEQFLDQAIVSGVEVIQRLPAVHGYKTNLICIDPVPLWATGTGQKADLTLGGFSYFDNSTTPRTFPLFASNFTRTYFNEKSGYLTFVPEAETKPEQVYEREFQSPTYTYLNDDDVPLQWMSIVPDVADDVRLICIWCDQWRPGVGTALAHEYKIFGFGSRVWRMTWRGVQHGNPVRYFHATLQTSLYFETGNIKVHYKNMTVSKLQQGAIGLQYNLSTAVNVEANFIDACAAKRKEAVMMLVPEHGSPCDGINCGNFGTCLEGFCMCNLNASYFGEYCQTPPASVTIYSDAISHNANQPVNLFVNFSKAVPGFTEASVISVFGNGFIVAGPPVMLVEYLSYRVLMQPRAQPATNITVMSPRNAMGFTEPSNNVTWLFSPGVYLKANTEYSNGMEPFQVTVSFSAPVKDFSWGVVQLTGNAFLTMPCFEVATVNYTCTIMPYSNGQRGNTSFFVAKNALNFRMSEPSNLLVVPYRASPVHFSYRSDFDVHGLVYWIGTLRRTVQAWSNPTNPSSCVRGVNCISAFRSSKGSLADDEDWCITRRTPKLCYTAAELNASWGIDLGNTRMQVVNYTLRDGEDFYGEMLRSWELQGSNDGGLNWTVIVRHENDTSLTRPHDSATFYVKQLPHNIAFRRIRVLMTGPNARGSQFLNLAGLELYGRLYDPLDPCGGLNCGYFGYCDYTTNGGCLCEDGHSGLFCEVSPLFWRKHVKPDGNAFGPNGIIYNLGVQMGSRPYQNPVLPDPLTGEQYANASRSSDHLQLVPRPSDPMWPTQHSPNCIFNRQPSNCGTSADFTEAWWQIDLLRRRVKLTGYSIRDGLNVSNQSPQMIRDWDLQASDDARSWLTIRQHRLDQNLSAPWIAATYDVVKTRAFRYFRVIMRNRNAGLTQFLFLSGFELYGFMYDRTDPCVNITCGLNGECGGNGVCLCYGNYTGPVCQYLPAVEPPPPPPALASFWTLQLIAVLAGSGLVMVCTAIMACYCYCRCKKRKLARAAAAAAAAAALKASQDDGAKSQAFHQSSYNGRVARRRTLVVEAALIRQSERYAWLAPELAQAIPGMEARTQSATMKAPKDTRQRDLASKPSRDRTTDDDRNMPENSHSSETLTASDRSSTPPPRRIDEGGGDSHRTPRHTRRLSPPDSARQGVADSMIRPVVLSPSPQQRPQSQPATSSRRGSRPAQLDLPGTPARRTPDSSVHHTPDMAGSRRETSSEYFESDTSGFESSGSSVVLEEAMDVYSPPPPSGNNAVTAMLAVAVDIPIPDSAAVSSDSDDDSEQADELAEAIQVQAKAPKKVIAAETATALGMPPSEIAFMKRQEKRQRHAAFREQLQRRRQHRPSPRAARIKPNAGTAATRRALGRPLDSHRSTGTHMSKATDAGVEPERPTTPIKPEASAEGVVEGKLATGRARSKLRCFSPEAKRVNGGYITTMNSPPARPRRLIPGASMTDARSLTQDFMQYPP